jgi:hypothetical protein
MSIISGYDVADALIIIVLSGERPSISLASFLHAVCMGAIDGPGRTSQNRTKPSEKHKITQR